MLSLRRAVSSSLGLLSVAVLSTVVQAQTVGWTFTTNMTIDSAPGHRSSMAMRTQATADKVRMEFVQIAGGGDIGQAEGMYMVLSPRDSTMLMVMPQQHMATITGTGLLGMVKPATAAFKHHVTRKSFVDLGPGERLLGHATHRYRVTTTETSDITIGGQTCTQASDNDTEVWIAPDVDMQPAVQAVASQYGMAGIGGAGIDTTGNGPSLPKGTALRTVMTLTRQHAGAPMTMTMKFEIVELSHGPIDNALFSVPADYKTMDTRAMMADVPAGMMDSIMNAQGSNMAKKLCDSQ
jgi:hypothetical protein